MTTEGANQKLGYVLIIAAILCFATLDAVSKYLAENYNVFFINMIRYWIFAVYVMATTAALTARSGMGSLKATVQSRAPWYQAARIIILIFTGVAMIWSYARIGLAETMTLFSAGPLLVTILSIPLLGERIGWHRRFAILAGFIGVLIILRPGTAVFTPIALVPLGCAFMFALYNIITRLVARFDDHRTSFFWTGIGGAVVISSIGVFFWDPFHGMDWFWIAIVGVLGALGHYLMIRALVVASASSIQPFFYMQLVFTTGYGIVIFDERITWNMAAGAVIIVASGLYTLMRERMKPPPALPEDDRHLASMIRPQK